MVRGRFLGAIFDMDGLLLDSEPHWDAVIEEVLAERGVVLNETMRQATIGMRLEETIGLWRSWFPLADLELEAVRRKMAAGMHCVAVPEAHNHRHPGFDAAHRRLLSLEELRAEHLQ